MIIMGFLIKILHKKLTFITDLEIHLKKSYLWYLVKVTITEKDLQAYKYKGEVFLQVVDVASLCFMQ